MPSLSSFPRPQSTWKKLAPGRPYPSHSCRISSDRRSQFFGQFHGQQSAKRAHHTHGSTVEYASRLAVPSDCRRTSAGLAPHAASTRPKADSAKLHHGIRWHRAQAGLTPISLWCALARPSPQPPDVVSTSRASALRLGNIGFQAARGSASSPPSPPSCGTGNNWATGPPASSARARSAFADQSCSVGSPGRWPQAMIWPGGRASPGNINDRFLRYAPR